MRKLLLVLVLMVALIVVTALPAAATPPSGVQFEVETVIMSNDPDPFIASGPAVDTGLVCDAGTVVELTGKATGFSSNGFNFDGIKHFTCEDGSGEFFVNVQARIDYRKGTTFNWNILSGSGAYEDFHGAGSGVGLSGIPCGDPDVCVLDVYDGGLHID